MGLGKEPFSNVKMDGFLGYSGMLNEISDFQEYPLGGFETRVFL
jgi:hypothetical protein